MIRICPYTTIPFPCSLNFDSREAMFRTGPSPEPLLQEEQGEATRNVMTYSWKSHSVTLPHSVLSPRATPDSRGRHNTMLRKLGSRVNSRTIFRDKLQYSSSVLEQKRREILSHYNERVLFIYTRNNKDDGRAKPLRNSV